MNNEQIDWALSAAKAWGDIKLTCNKPLQVLTDIGISLKQQCLNPGRQVRDIAQLNPGYPEFELLAACLAHTKDVIMITEAEPHNSLGQRIVYVNEAFEKMTGYAREEAIGNTPRMLQGAKSDPVTRSRISEHLKNWKPVRAEVLNYTKDGREFWIELDINPLADATGWYTHWISIQRDITERKTAEQFLSQYKAIIDSTEDAVLSKNCEGIITSWNVAAEKLYGYSAKEMIGQSIFILVPNESQEDLHRLMMRVEMGESIAHYRASRSHKDGHQISVSLCLSPMKNLLGEVIGISSTAKDISKDIQQEALVHEMAFYDPLTKLANRRLLDDHITQALAISNRTNGHGALIYIDLDNFKSLNDTHGHQAGDSLLIEVGRRLMSCMREIDTVSRVGGDEFIILVNQLEQDDVLAKQAVISIAQKVRLLLEMPYFLKTSTQETEIFVTHHCTASIGVTLFSGVKKSLAKIMKEADAAMYKAKHAGRNTVHFHLSIE